MISSIIGTLCYMTAVVMKRSYDERCDTWPLAVILYILSDSSRFYGASDKETIVLIQQIRIDFKTTVCGLNSREVSYSAITD